MSKHVFRGLLLVAPFTVLLSQANIAMACRLQGSSGSVHFCQLNGGTNRVAPYVPTSKYEYTVFCDFTDGRPYWVQGHAAATCLSEVGPTQTEQPSKGKTNSCGSIIDVGGQVLSEEIQLVGTSMFLRYDSSRSWGYIAGRTLKEPITGATVPSALAQVSMSYEIAGKTHTDTYTTFTPNMKTNKVWDGYNVSAVFVGGTSQCAYRSKTEQRTTPGCDSDGHCDIEVSTPDNNSGDCGSTSTNGVPIGGFLAKPIGLGGWTLSEVHHYDFVRQQVDLGNGGSFAVGAQYVVGYFRAGAPDKNEIYVFNSSGQHLGTLNALTGSAKLTITYHPDGRLNTVTDAYSNVLTVTYDGSNRATKITAPFGHETNLTVDSSNNLTRVTSPDTTYHEMTYMSGDGLLATFKKPLGQTSTFTYDGEGRLTQDAGVDSFIANLTRSSVNPTQVKTELTSGAGAVTQHDTYYNTSPNQILTKKTRAGGKESTTYTQAANYDLTTGLYRSSLYNTYAADPRFNGGVVSRKFVNASTFSLPTSGSLATTVSKSVSYVSGTGPFNINTLTTNYNVGGNVYQEVYSGPSNTLTYSTPLSRTTTVALNSQERPTSYQFADLTAASLTYNSAGQVSRIDQGARYVEYTYNGDGRVSSVENALGEITSYTYDANGRILTSTLPNLNVITYAWDANGNVTAVTPPSRSAHGFTYTASDKVETYDPPTLSGTVQTAYQYDVDRRIKKIIRPNADQVTLNYTSHNLTSIVIPLGTYSYNYDSSSNLLTSTTSAYGVTTTFARNGVFVTSENVTVGGKGRIDYLYDSKLRLWTADIKNSSGSTLSSLQYTYNNDSEITAAGSLNLTRHSTRAYITGLSVGSVSETRGYNSFGELNSQSAVYSSTTLYGSAITRDNLGRVTQNVETIGGVTTTYDYTYNNVGRLVTVDKNSAAYASYVYGTNGNRTSRTISGVTENATTDAQDRLLTHGTLSFTYNQNGEVATKTDSATSAVTSYTFDALGNLKRVDLPSTNYVEYIMDGFNRRIGRKYNGTVDRYFVYQNQLQVAAEVDSAGALIARYVYASRSNVPDYMEKSGVNYRIVSDPLGSVRLVVRASDGVTMQRIDYDEFGRVLSDSNPGFQPFGFAGGLYDGATGLVHFGAREYDAETGRWLSKDPIRFAGGDTNLYGYVLSDPVNLIDPTGLEVGDWWDLPSNFRRAREIAGEELARRPNSHNDIGDAMRHAEWSRRMTQEINPFTAWVAGTGHELEGMLRGQPWSELLMDLHNNGVGRNSGASVNQGLLWTLPLGGSQYNPYRNQCGGQ